MANVAMNWNFAGDEKVTANIPEPTQRELVQTERSAASVISTPSNRSFSYLSAETTGNNVQLVDSPDLDVVSLAAESGCSAQVLEKVGSFGRYV